MSTTLAMAERTPARRRAGLGRTLARHRGLLVAFLVFVALFLVVDWISPGPFSYFELSFMSSGGATLALAAMGQTFVILSGGFDLSAGAVISLVNVVLATWMGESVGSQLAMTVAALLIGGTVGAFNGFFVAFVRLQPIVVTLASMFIVQGITLLIMDKPGGMIAPEFSMALTGDVITDLLPAPIVVLLAALLVWFLVRNSRFGTGIYAVGSDEEAARAAGIATRSVKFWAYTLAGLFYGAAGAFISAQTGSADPLIGRPMLLQVFTAVVLGGTMLGGGRGGAVGSLVGAYILMIVVNILLVLNVSAYYSSVVEGLILIIAVLAGSFHRNSPVAGYLRLLATNLRARRTGTLARSHPAQPFSPELPAAPLKAGQADGASWLERHRQTLRYLVPAYVGFVVVLLATHLIYGSTLTNPAYFNSLLVLSSFLAILALGQGTAILTGGLDLSLPWMIGLIGIVTADLISGSDAAALWVIPFGLLLGTALGMANGAGIVFLGLPPIVMTIAMNGILQGAALVYSDGTPAGFASPTQRWLMTGSFLGVTPVIWLLVLFVVVALLLLGRTVFGRRVYAVGNSPLVAQLSGVGVGGTLIRTYALSGFCAALVGILLSGFSGQASLGMGDEYLLPSIAAVVVGGTLITGGRGHYLGMLGGVLLLTALATLLAGTTLPSAVRDIILGVVVLVAVLALRDRNP
ncbi:MAG TPA: ABC transporter permease [Geminicoccus sp.]|uniref:ABC transporter permease n=1 Tax=Geminicoccus sp. TaxID=2024832 RepID=UPI002C51FD80|nr:ABC transporter permease [Geminicoccus sp.]HWL67372.1 ABC transporter permease [Geminicoccus sp.]